MQIKELFLNAVIVGDLGKTDDYGVIVTISEFKLFFKDKIKSDYINSFLPAATIESGLVSCSHTKYLFRIRKGTYRVHPDAIKEQIKNNIKNEIMLHKTISVHEPVVNQLNPTKDNWFSLLN